MKGKVIYDLGANNGDDIGYYLARADVVVAVEANPLLCETIKRRFGAEIQSGRLAVENCAVTAQGARDTVDFFIHRTNHVLSQLPPPSPVEATLFDRVTIPARTIVDILRDHGEPYYIKIDIEHYDAPILRALFGAGVFPTFISAESHSIEVFSLLVKEGGYDSFKLVDGEFVSHDYSDRALGALGSGRKDRFRFPPHSAGPFGNDLHGSWMDTDTFLRVLAFEKLGWKDIHATKREVDGSLRFQSFLVYLLRYLLRIPRRALIEVRRRLRANGRDEGQQWQ